MDTKIIAEGLRRMKMKHVLLFILCLFLVTGCSSQKNSVFTASKNDDLFAHLPGANQPEVKYGYKIYMRMLAEADIVKDPRIHNPINELGKRLAQHASRQSFPYVFTVINDERIFAASTPGGYFYVSSGMLRYLPHEDELAYILALEIALRQKRPLRFTRRFHFAKMVQGLSSYASYGLGPEGALLPKGVGLVNNYLLKEKVSAKKVLEADKECLAYLAKEGFHLSVTCDVLNKVIAADSGVYDLIKTYKRLRPVSIDRIRALREAVSSYEMPAT